jgi:choline dehydrogenase-like flavoprotein
MARERFDAIIVGSGFGAAPPALRLTRAGLKVLVLEKGPEIVPARDFRQTQDPRYLLRWFRNVGGGDLSLTYIEGLGGGSGFYEMVTLRAPTSAFDQTWRGRRLWPDAIDRKAMDPWYARAESEMCVKQIRPEAVPASGRVFARILGDLGHDCERARYAESGCVNSGFCVTGCIYNAKMGPLTTYIPLAREAGAEYRCEAEVTKISNARGGGYDLAVRFSPEAEDRRIHAPVVILAAGTVGTARLLMGSRRKLRIPSEHLGRNIAWNGGVKAAALLAPDLPDGDMFVGRTHAGVICYDFLRSHGISVSAVKAMPLMILHSVRMRENPDDPFWGQKHVDLMRQFRRRVLALYAMGLAPPSGCLEMGRRGNLRASLQMSPELADYYARTKKLLKSLLERRGCRPLHLEFLTGEGMPHQGPHAGTAHQVGSCRMADRPEDGVCTPDGQVFGHPGLYITDGSAVPSSLAVNPCLTITANSERITAGILERAGVRSSAAA